MTAVSCIQQLQPQKYVRQEGNRTKEIPRSLFRFIHHNLSWSIVSQVPLTPSMATQRSEIKKMYCVEPVYKGFHIGIHKNNTVKTVANAAPPSKLWVITKCCSLLKSSSLTFILRSKIINLLSSRMIAGFG
jgi:hypothetical protein